MQIMRSRSASHRLSEQRREVRRFRSEINITPFVDVVLILLVIFAVSHTEKALPSLLVNLPNASRALGLDSEQSVVLTITKKGTIYVNDKLSREANLETDLMSATKGKEAQVFLRGDEGVSYGAIMRVVNLLSGYGLRKVALVADNSVVADVGSSAGRT
ncbi:biopolymer transporter ExbD [Anaplasma marginale]|uniref:TOLR protein (TolR) n=3 Tax=Anaplasma marginale TaxID=770 RepID=B9KI08_ANAMF|nr:TolR protein [Anaplasma marginale str. St. Maries]ACM49120.1 TOLR protein (tolR) [Anaplasma marginale str. Florida]AGZ78685.1 biopolymer transporter ExbD [Anaplasma marginale str. Gypsy Plains]AXW83877.1 biopolymer transporter ExbD [Anaplasma marginale]AXW84796.1 biopolymer transporter ExbD [Anaplasma marginale]